MNTQREQSTVTSRQSPTEGDHRCFLERTVHRQSATEVVWPWEPEGPRGPVGPPGPSGDTGGSAKLLTRWFFCMLLEEPANRPWVRALIAQYLSTRCEVPRERLETVADMPVIYRISWNVDTLYRGLSALRGMRSEARKLLKDGRLNVFELASDGMDDQAPELMEAKQILGAAKELVSTLEKEISFFKTLERYVAAQEPWPASTLVAWGGEPDGPMNEQNFIVYAVKSVTDGLVFPSLDTQAWLHDLYAHSHSHPEILLCAEQVILFEDIDLGQRLRGLTKH